MLHIWHFWLRKMVKLIFDYFKRKIFQLKSLFWIVLIGDLARRRRKILSILIITFKIASFGDDLVTNFSLPPGFRDRIHSSFSPTLNWSDTKLKQFGWPRTTLNWSDTNLKHPCTSVFFKDLVHLKKKTLFWTSKFCLKKK